MYVLQSATPLDVIFADRVTVDGVTAAYTLSECDRDGQLHIRGFIMADSLQQVAKHLNSLECRLLFTDLQLLAEIPKALLNMASVYEDLPETVSSE